MTFTNPPDCRASRKPHPLACSRARTRAQKRLHLTEATPDAYFFSTQKPGTYVPHLTSHPAPVQKELELPLPYHQSKRIIPPVLPNQSLTPVRFRLFSLPRAGNARAVGAAEAGSLCVCSFLFPRARLWRANGVRPDPHSTSHVLDQVVGSCIPLPSCGSFWEGERPDFFYRCLDVVGAYRMQSAEVIANGSAQRLAYAALSRPVSRSLRVVM